MENMPTYNTTMAVAAGTALLLLVGLGYQVGRGRSVHRPAWAVAFAALGFIVVLLGGHMTLTWPLTGPTSFDNITFGEPSLGMGVLLIAGAVLLGSKRFWPLGEAGSQDELTVDSWPNLTRLLTPLSLFAFAMGLAMIAIAFIGPVYAPWEAPPTEPISSEVANHQWIENGFISAIYLLIGIGALLSPFAIIRGTFDAAKGLLKIIGVCWLITGVILILFGAMNFYTHSGNEINTFEQQQSAQEAGG